MGEGVLNQTRNPEVTVNIHETNSIVDRTTLQLHQTTVKLRNAFNGHPLWFLSTGMVTCNVVFYKRDY